MVTALLDSGILSPGLQCDVLLALAADGMYRPVWSVAILAELQHAEITERVRHGDLHERDFARAAGRVIRLRRAFKDAEISGWEGLAGTFGLPDPRDEHVLAAAVVAGAGFVVTLNTKAFPAGRLPLGIQTLTPAQFAVDTVSVDPPRALNAIRSIAGRSGRRGHARTVDELLDLLVLRFEFNDAVDLLRSAS